MDHGINDNFDVLIKLNIQIENKRLVIHYFENSCHDQSEENLTSFTNKIFEEYKDRIEKKPIKT